MKIVYLFLKVFFSITSVLSPSFAGRLAIHLFQKPHFKKSRSREDKLYEEFLEIRIPFQDEDLYVYVKGNKNNYPLILVHGWDSNPGSLYAIASALAKQDYYVLVLGLPAHGKSKLKKTSMPHSSSAIKALLDELKLKENFSMITHSFGSGASSMALMNAEIQSDHLIFLSSPDRIIDIFEEYSAMIGLGAKAYQEMLIEVEKLMTFSVDEFNISDFLLQVNYKKLFIIQDEKDKVLPWDNALNIKVKNSEAILFPMQNKGHYRLLWDEEVIQLVSDLLPGK